MQHEKYFGGAVTRANESDIKSEITLLIFLERQKKYFNYYYNELLQNTWQIANQKNMGR